MITKTLSSPSHLKLAFGKEHWAPVTHVSQTVTRVPSLQDGGDTDRGFNHGIGARGNNCPPGSGSDTTAPHRIVLQGRSEIRHDMWYASPISTTNIVRAVPPHLQLQTEAESPKLSALASATYEPGSKNRRRPSHNAEQTSHACSSGQVRSSKSHAGSQREGVDQADISPAQRSNQLSVLLEFRKTYSSNKDHFGGGFEDNWALQPTLLLMA